MIVKFKETLIKCIEFKKQSLLINDFKRITNLELFFCELNGFVLGSLLVTSLPDFHCIGTSAKRLMAQTPLFRNFFDNWIIFSHFNQSDHFFHQILLGLSFLIFVKKQLSENSSEGITIDCMRKAKISLPEILFLVF